MNNPNLGSSQAPVVLQRQSNLPVLQPRPDLTWERGAVLNAALVWREGQYHLLYRAIDHSSAWPKDPRYRSSVGYAVSSDGLSWQTRTEPVVPIDFKPGVDAEDPRVTFLEGRYHMTYCWWDYVNGVPVPGHCVSDDLIHWKDHRILVPFDQHGFNKNAVLFPQRVRGRYVLLHRPEAAANRGRPAAEFNWRT